MIKAAAVPPIEFRQFRKVFLTYYASAMGGKASMRDVQGIAGHSSARTTQEIYLQPVPASQREALRRLRDLWLGRDGDDPQVQKPEDEKW